MFQQRHFETVAKVLQDLQLCADAGSDGRRVAQLARRAVVELFLADNPRFNVGRFERACVPGANVRARRVAA